MNKFHNPYAGHTKPTVQTPISVEDYNLIKCIRPGLGTISGTMGTLWNKLCYALRERGITDYSKSSEFEHFVANCTIVDGKGLQHGPTNSPVTNCNAPNESPTVQGTCDEDQAKQEMEKAQQRLTEHRQRNLGHH